MTGQGGTADAVRLTPPDAPPDVEVGVPGSKSVTNRALVAATLASGTSALEGALLADDTEAMIGCLTALGVRVRVDRARARVEVDGTAGRLPPGPATLDARLSGTTARFVAPLLALGRGPYRLDAAAPMRARPVEPMVQALTDLGADVVAEQEPGHLPLAVRRGGVRGGAVSIGGDVSSQFLSGLLLAAPAMPEGLRITCTTRLVSEPYVALTESVMDAFGVTVGHEGSSVYVVTPQPYRATVLAVEPDASAASYFFAAAAVTGGRVRVPGLGPGSAQGDVRFVDVLEQMGMQVRRDATGTEVAGGGGLRGVDVDLADCSDTAQTLAVTAVFADGPTRIRGIGFIRRKETDRIGAVVHELQRCGIDAVEEEDGLLVRPGRPRPARIATYRDHRMAMSFALLGLRVPGVEITDPGCVDKTFPDFWERFARLGVTVTPVRARH